MVFAKNRRLLKARNSTPDVQTSVSNLPVKVSPTDSTEPSNMKDMWGIHSLIRGGIAFGMSVAYGYYLDNRIFASNKELMRAGLIGGSVLTSDALGNAIFPHLTISKDQGIREIENMVIEPLFTGLLYSAGKYLLIDQNESEIMYDIIKGSVVDLGSGIAFGFAMNMM